MAPGKEPQFLARLSEDELEPSACEHQIWGSLENGNGVGGQGGKIFWNDEAEIRLSGIGHLAKAVEIDREPVGGLADGDILSGSGGDSIKFAGVAGELSQDLPTLLPSIELEDPFEHDHHSSAVPRVAGPDPPLEPRVCQIGPAVDLGQP